MIYNKSKSTQRFNFEVNRNSTAKKAGSNIVKISTRSSSDKYATGTSSLTMTVKEARALQGFLDAGAKTLILSQSGSSIQELERIQREVLPLLR